MNLFMALLLRLRANETPQRWIARLEVVPEFETRGLCTSLLPLDLFWAATAERLMQALPVVESIDGVLDGHAATVRIGRTPIFYRETGEPLRTMSCTLSSESVE